MRKRRTLVPDALILTTRSELGALDLNAKTWLPQGRSVGRCQYNNSGPSGGVNAKRMHRHFQSIFVWFDRLSIDLAALPSYEEDDR
jgi:hypothetical protein